MKYPRFGIALVSASILFLAGMARAQIFTLQFSSGALPPIPLVNHGDTWRYHYGTNAPGAGWQIETDAVLDPVLWGSGPGGFGYEDGDDATLITTMSNRFTTVYIRRSFEISEAVDAARRLQLEMDYDDGYIAWLDGVEIARSPNAPGAVGTEPANTATSLAPNHEASSGASGNPPTVLDLGLVGSRLQPGTHVLAIMGLNGAITSSDLSLIADLSLTGGSGSVTGGNFFTLVTASPVTMSGDNTFPGSARVSVNGVDAAFNPGAGTWSKSQPLTPGLNRLFIAALDASGAILASTNRDVIYEAATVAAGGTLGSDATWNSASGVVRVTNDVIVPGGVTLNINEGVVVLVASSSSIRATGGGNINVNGTEANPCLFLPASGSGNWGALNATGNGSSTTARHIETAGGAITFGSQATGLIEDSYLHDRGSILTANGAGLITTRRLHVKNYDETIYNSATPVLAEDSLYEGLFTPSSDALEIQGGLPGSIIRRCTFRRSVGSNSDAVDFNGTSGALIESCLIHDFTDKAISLGAAASGGANDNGIVISNCLIYNVDTGIAVKDGSTASILQTTVGNAVYGIRLNEKFPPQGGGQVTNAQNNIIWGQANPISVENGGAIVIDYSDVQGMVFPGTANISADPLFANPVGGDFRLLEGSPAADAGFDDSDMGALSSVGGLPPPPFDLAALVSGNNPIQLTWREDADNESGFALQRSVDGATWIDAGDFGPGVTNVMDNITLPDVLYFYRVRATNFSGLSRYSNLASAIRRSANTLVGGTLTGNTVWSPASGTIVVTSTVVVPGSVTLSVLPGTVVKLTNNTSIIAAGGVIDIAGTTNNRVRLMPLFGTNLWGQISAQFTGGVLNLRHADVLYGQVTVYSNAVGILEDSYIHDYRRAGGSLFTAPIILTHYPAAPMVIRRCHVREYHEVLLRNGVQHVEECLFEDIYGDAVDFDSAMPGSFIRWCSFRHGTRGNVDAVDVGPGDIPGSTDLRIENCLMFDFPFDKGVSVGDAGASHGTIVSNCLIYACLSGVMSKDRCDVSVRNCTIANNNWGFTNYNKVNPASPTGGGITTNSYNNILWGNTITIGLVNDSMLFCDHNDLGSTNWPGTGNIDVDPLFVNAVARDYRLLPGSPCIGAGRNGETMGARLPVGAPMVPSNPSISDLRVSGGSAVIGFWADSEKTYSLECSPNASGGPWISIASATTNDVPRFLNVTNAVAAGNRFYRLQAQ